MRVEIETFSCQIRDYSTLQSSCLSSLLGKFQQSSPRFGAIPHLDFTTDNSHRGLAWHTDEVALRTKFEEFGAVEEAVRSPPNPTFHSQNPT